MKYREVARKLRKLGCEEIPRRGGGSHRKWHNPASGGFAPIPDWGSKDLKIGTLRHIVQLLDLDWEEFLRA
ncbi:MAG: type II toxin-antitoxin system HicA family toxin [Anaerolineae bacterium]|nr:type II toxin-antitoxin system HicA family toxin [Anaerolineae bacterium]